MISKTRCVLICGFDIIYIVYQPVGGLFEQVDWH